MIITISVTTLLAVWGVRKILDNDSTGYFLLGALVIVLVPALFYGPKSISVDSQMVTVNTWLRKHRIPLAEIESVELFQPTMGSIRICGSGGYMGYWGIFREGDIGRYVAYYGKSSNCFLIRMRNGDKYVLGCENPAEMVEYINSRI